MSSEDMQREEERNRDVNITWRRRRKAFKHANTDTHTDRERAHCMQ